MPGTFTDVNEAVKPARTHQSQAKDIGRGVPANTTTLVEELNPGHEKQARRGLCPVPTGQGRAPRGLSSLCPDSMPSFAHLLIFPGTLAPRAALHWLCSSCAHSKRTTEAIQWGGRSCPGLPEGPSPGQAGHKQHPASSGSPSPQCSG